MATNEPMMASVAGRYASALFELATDENAVGDIERDLNNFQKLYDESEDLRRLLRSPVLSTQDQDKGLGALLAKIGATSVTTNFFRLIAKNRRLSVAPDMVRAFKALAANARGEVTAEVISATPLSSDQAAALKATLKDSLGKDVLLSTQVDPQLLGGLIVKIGSRMIDSSLRTKLSAMKSALASSA